MCVKCVKCIKFSWGGTASRLGEVLLLPRQNLFSKKALRPRIWLATKRLLTIQEENALLLLHFSGLVYLSQLPLNLSIHDLQNFLHHKFFLLVPWKPLLHIYLLDGYDFFWRQALLCAPFSVM